ncbi:MAG: CPBP family intramembrane metalloprotease [Candidatus Symbiothrix sp.]|jgi:membrane protease YdiL (CAAX protease family)|nr:CPBP family intramembrane metalloprotease [Candidatus Symbiothrix sp.]
MLLKGAFKDSSVFIQLLMFSIVVFIGFLATTFMSAIFLLMKFGFSPEIYQDIQQNLLNYPDLIRNMQFFQVIFMFIFPAIVCAWLFSDNYKNYLKIDTSVPASVIPLTILSVVVAVPFLNFTYIVNQQMVFPEWLSGVEQWMKEMEEANGKILEKMLYVHSAWDLVFNILIVCVLTGIGEEFIFRGVLQNSFGKVLKNPHAVIWTVAIVFSAIHFQFYGFIPRLLLGAYFGYLVYYTKNLWIPALAHFTNNCVSVILAYLYQDTPGGTDEIDALGYGSTWWLAVASLAVFLIFFQKIKKTKN